MVKRTGISREKRIPGTRLWYPNTKAKTPESFCHVLSRCERVFEKIVPDLEQGKDVLIVAHGGIYRGFTFLTSNHDAPSAKNCTPYRFALNADNRWEISEA